MVKFKKKLFLFFLSLYLIIGSYNSINTGISFDENYEELNWNFHVNLVKDVTNSIISKEKLIGSDHRAPKSRHKKINNSDNSDNNNNNNDNNNNNNDNNSDNQDKYNIKSKCLIQL